MKNSSFPWALIRALGVMLIASFAAAAADAPPEPDSYRQSEYRAPTPASLKGARVLTTEEAAAMWRAGEGAFIDVLPQAPFDAWPVRPTPLPAESPATRLLQRRAAPLRDFCPGAAECRR